jgi:hypothetical protein
VRIQTLLLWIGIAIVCLAVGFFVGRCGTGPNSQQIADFKTQIIGLEYLNSRFKITIGDANKTITRLNDSQRKLADINTGLTESNKRLDDIVRRLSDSSQGAIEIIDGLIDQLTKN